jgi:photosystem II stability/assembly factor-like uncharacterized protein
MTVLLAAGCGITSNSTQPAQQAWHSQTPRPAASATASATARAAATAPATAAAPGSTCAPGVIGPESASFISPGDGWLLGVTLQGCWPSNSARIVLRKTTDGGRHWTPIDAPPAPWGGGSTVRPADSVDEIYFADARDGWAFGPGLWATHDGGATWHRVDTRGRSVYSMAATDGHVIAAFQRCVQECSSGSASSFAIETSPAGADAWRPVKGGGGLGLPVVTAAGGTAYALGAAGAGAGKGPGASAYGPPTLLLSGPADGSAPWHRRATPCVTMGADTVTAMTASSLLMACGLLGAHPTTNHLYRSEDSGAHWRQFAHVGLYDGVLTVAATPDGKLFVDGILDGIALSRDGGRSWLRPATVDATDQVQAGGLVDAAMTTNNDGYLVARYGPFWITSDGGVTWTPVTVR